ncbi:RNA polymerase factor sigma-70 [Anaerocolumna cellulosilytica]|uniref:RNA polymerase sigma factor SigS n=1 Tax=Anaerocolumna cellulosilytica TaxID=433286 RepID=A0A6S6QW99_9FIRM|nr:RNA polymerase sporulation sigma factor SigH [Anaerocolumna cellulosilytica]MBB5194395.1 RNA polymerase sporulation-specific sigma factor [Anaerocolumna cellulosilytica]BCJ93339.1 RNA polymerase factor sigma-70 [Anaerocolumna cellulosilytica]
MPEYSWDALSDEDIITLIHGESSDAMDYMLNRYKNLVRKKAKALYLIGGDKDDLIQEGMIGLYKAIRDYKLDMDNSFYNFADLCISRQIYSAIKASNRKKNFPLNTYVSLYTPAYGENTDLDEKESLVDLMYENKISNPEQLVIDKESTSMLEYELVRHLSQFEKNVLDLYLSDYTYTQIADKLMKEPKSIDNALQRIKLKLNKVLKEL